MRLTSHLTTVDTVATYLTTACPVTSQAGIGSLTGIRPVVDADQLYIWCTCLACEYNSVCGGFVAEHRHEKQDFFFKEHEAIRRKVS